MNRVCRYYVTPTTYSLKARWLTAPPFIEPEEMSQWHSIVSSFQSPIRYAMAYGSGALRQSAESKGKMLDFIFAVTHPEHWHWHHLHQYPDHYPAWMRWTLPATSMRARVAAHLQDCGPAGLFYISQVRIKDRTIKYGVISMDRLCADLMQWESLYTAGRLQKPVHVLRDEPRVRAAQQVNLANAVRVALLQLPEQFSERALYNKLASISYNGDPRMMTRMEDPKKIDNMLDYQMSQFQDWYAQTIEDLPSVAFSRGAYLQQDKSESARLDHLRRLPQKLTKFMIQRHSQKSGIAIPQSRKEVDTWDEAFQSLLKDELFDRYLHDGIAAIVGPAARRQTVKGLVTAGPLVSAQYLWRKWRKGRQ